MMTLQEAAEAYFVSLFEVRIFVFLSLILATTALVPVIPYRISKIKREHKFKSLTRRMGDMVEEAGQPFSRPGDYNLAACEPPA